MTTTTAVILYEDTQEFGAVTLAQLQALSPAQLANVEFYIADDNEASTADQDKRVTLDVLQSFMATSSGKYRHDQAVAATVWNVPHNLNADIDSVNVWVGNELVEATVARVDANNLTITFSLLQSGYAIIEAA